MSTVADRIKQRREELNMTQTDLAIALGLSDRSSVTKIEKSGNDITLKNVERIAKILKVSPSYLMGWVPSPIDLPDGDDMRNYYTNKETAQIAQEIFDNKDLLILFDAAKGSKPEDLKIAADMLKRFKETNPNG